MEIYHRLVFGIVKMLKADASLYPSPERDCNHFSKINPSALELLTYNTISAMTLHELRDILYELIVGCDHRQVPRISIIIHRIEFDLMKEILNTSANNVNTPDLITECVKWSADCDNLEERSKKIINAINSIK